MRGFFIGYSVPKLTTLSTRLSTTSTDRLAVSNPVSWRDGRTSSTQRGYTYKWQRYREWFLRDNPLCVYCQRKGDIKAASVVDHIEPHKGNMTLFWLPRNHQALCKSCHDSIKQREERKSGK